MSHQEPNFEKPDEELELSSGYLQIPTTVKWGCTAISLLLIGFYIFSYFTYVESPQNMASPSELGLAPIFLFALAMLGIVHIPWADMGVRISKIGGIEFKEIVEGQALEHATDISQLEERIEFLENAIRESDEMKSVGELFSEPAVKKLLLSFLERYHQWAFSPSRIRAWGSKQQGFSDLAKYDIPFLRSTLQKMVAEGTIETRVSKKGNTLFRSRLR